MLNNYAATLANFKQFCEEYRIRYGMHLIGCEFFTGNKEVDGWVTSVYSIALPCLEVPDCERRSYKIRAS